MTISELPEAEVQQNNETLEALYIESGIKMPWLESSYFVGQGSGGLVDISVATLARYGNQALISEMLEAEEYEAHGYQTYGYYDSSFIRTLSTLYTLWVDKKSIITRADNLLIAPENNAGWKPQLNYEMAQLIVKKGSLLDYNASHFGWEVDSYERDEYKARKVVAAFNLKESRWGKFSGTGAEDDYIGAFVMEVMYHTGEFRKLVYESDLGSIMRELS